MIRTEACTIGLVAVMDRSETTLVRSSLQIVQLKNSMSKSEKPPKVLRDVVTWHPVDHALNILDRAAEDRLSLGIESAVARATTECVDAAGNR